jgi:hypothetical protein
MVTANKNAYKFPRMRDPTYQAFLAACGLTRCHVPKDGQCLFTAVAVASGLHRDLTTEPVKDGLKVTDTIKRTQELWSAAQVLRRLVCEALGNEKMRNVLSTSDALTDPHMDQLKMQLETTLCFSHIQRGVLKEDEWGEVQLLRLLAIALERPVVLVWSKCEKPLTTTVYSPKL